MYKITTANVDAIAILSKFDAIRPYLNLNVAGEPSRKRGACPRCGGTDRFLFDNKRNEGTWYCQGCGAGNWFTLIRMVTGMSNREIFQSIQGASVVTSGAVAPAAVAALGAEALSERKHKLALSWERGETLAPNNAAGRYLLQRVRGLRLSMLADTLRHHFGMKFRDTDSGNGDVDGGYWPTLLAKVKDGTCKPVTLHRTYLTKDGEKAPFAKVKKLMPGVRKLEGAAIRLNKAPSRVLAITEGIETGLSVLVAHEYRIHVWALVSAVNLSMADIPDGMFDRVVIYADHDPIDTRQGYRPGEHHAQLLQEKLQARGMACDIVLPEKEGEDFADMWQRGAPFSLAI